MKKIIWIFLFSSLSVCSSFAETLDDPLSEEEITTSFKAKLTLSSLKNLKDTAIVNQAPFVQEIKTPYEVRTLFVESQALPIVDIQLTFRAGSAQDETIGKGLYGIANMAATLMPEGTAHYSATEINQIFEQLGAKFSVKAYRDMFVVKLRVMSDPEKLNQAVNLMLEVINHSTFENSSLNRMLSNTQVGQRQLKEDPNRLIDIQLYRSLYGTHPYAEPITGTNASIRKITPALLQQFRSQLLVTKNLNIALTGQMTAQAAEQLATKVIRSLPAGQAAPLLSEPKAQSGFHIKHIPYAATQAYVNMSQIGVAEASADRPALELANQMLGGAGFNSLLMKELRVKRGYTYGAYSTITFPRVAGLFSINYSTQQNQLFESINVAHQTLIKFVNSPINSKQLEETRTGLLRSFPMTYSSNASMNAQLGFIGFYGLPSDYLTRYPKQIASLSTKDVERAIKKHLHPDQLTLIIGSENLDEPALLQMLEHNIKPE